jgi:hypothetical protein
MSYTLEGATLGWMDLPGKWSVLAGHILTFSKAKPRCRV